MMNFKTFFENSITDIKLASNPNHRTDKGITNPKKPNIVARYLSPHNDYNNQSVVGAKYNSGNRLIRTNQELQKIINDYGINLEKRDKTQPFEISLKQRDANGTGRFLVYDPQKGYSIQIKKA